MGIDSPSVAYTGKLTTRNVFVERTLELAFVSFFIIGGARIAYMY